MIRADLKDRKISEEVWYNEAATPRARWRATYRQACADTNYREQHQEQAAHQVQCLKCQRTFRRESDIKDINACLKGGNQCQSSAELYSVQPARGGSAVVEV